MTIFDPPPPVFDWRERAGTEAICGLERKAGATVYSVDCGCHGKPAGQEPAALSPTKGEHRARRLELAQAYDRREQLELLHYEAEAMQTAARYAYVASLKKGVVEMRQARSDLRRAIKRTGRAFRRARDEHRRLICLLERLR